MPQLHLTLAQINPMVGDIDGNLKRIIDAYLAACNQACVDAIVFPELALTGYPPEDLLLRASLDVRINKALAQLAKVTCESPVALIVGYPVRRDGKLFNCAGVFLHGECVLEYRKQCLPNYQVFDEKRYFEAGHDAGVFTLKGLRIAVSVCEDIWHAEPMQQARQAQAQLMINLNASPFHANKQHERERLVAQRAQEGRMPVVYVNQVGGQDELVFDGCSFVVDAGGTLLCRLPRAKKFNAILMFRLADPRASFSSMASHHYPI